MKLFPNIPRKVVSRRTQTNSESTFRLKRKNNFLLVLGDVQFLQVTRELVILGGMRLEDFCFVFVELHQVNHRVAALQVYKGSQHMRVKVHRQCLVVSGKYGHWSCENNATSQIVVSETSRLLK